MKRWFLMSMMFLSFLTSSGQEPLNVMTFNIRYDTPADSLNAWPYRRDFAASEVLFHEVDLLGIQEALARQVKDLQERLPAYGFIGVGRDDGKEKGEFSGIFYNNNRLQLLKSETFWLSETPEVSGSKSWDAAITRIVTWGKFRDKKTRKEFFFFNTHFDHIGKVARRESARLLLRRINEIAGKSPVILTGDFNAKPNDEPIQVILNPDDALRLTDTKELSATPHFGPNGTFTGFRAKELDDKPIDYIFVRNGVSVLKHATFSQTWGGRFSSDHFPVFARVQIK